jgi:hypothetical protein
MREGQDGAPQRCLLTERSPSLLLHIVMQESCMRETLHGGRGLGFLGCKTPLKVREVASRGPAQHCIVHRGKQHTCRAGPFCFHGRVVGEQLIRSGSSNTVVCTAKYTPPGRTYVQYSSVLAGVASIESVTINFWDCRLLRAVEEPLLVGAMRPLPSAPQWSACVFRTGETAGGSTRAES